MALWLKIIFGVLAALLLFATYQFFRTRHYIAIGEAQAAAAVPYSQENSNATFRILIIGDSTVVGTGAEDPQHSVAGYLGADFPNAELVNLGVNGTRTHGLIERFEGIQDQHFDLILIHTGGNDIVYNTDRTELAKDLATVLDLAKNIGDEVLLLSCGDVGTGLLFPFGTRWIFTARTKAVREIFMPLAESKGVHYVDLFRSPKDDHFAQDPDRYYSPDYFHPSGAGYRDWYEHVKIVLEGLSFSDDLILYEKEETDAR